MCGVARKWSRPSHQMDCPRRPRLNGTDKLLARRHRTTTLRTGLEIPGAHPSVKWAPHEVCRIAFADGGTACSRCTVYLCGDEECEHEACKRDRWHEDNSWA